MYIFLVVLLMNTQQQTNTIAASVTTIEPDKIQIETNSIAEILPDFNIKHIK